MFLLLGGRVVELRVEKILDRDAFSFHLRAEFYEPLRCASNLVESYSAKPVHAVANFLDQVGDPCVQNTPQSLVSGQAQRSVGKARERGIVKAAEERSRIANLIERKDAGIQPVIQIGGEIGDLIRQIDKLGLKRRKSIEKIFGELGMVFGGIVARVFHDALADGQGEIKPAKCRVALLKPGH